MAKYEENNNMWWFCFQTDLGLSQEMPAEFNPMELGMITDEDQDSNIRGEILAIENALVAKTEGTLAYKKVDFLFKCVSYLNKTIIFFPGISLLSYIQCYSVTVSNSG